jgi:hypothetical protein
VVPGWFLGDLRVPPGVAFEIQNPSFPMGRQTLTIRFPSPKYPP